MALASNHGVEGRSSADDPVMHPGAEMPASPGSRELLKVFLGAVLWLVLLVLSYFSMATVPILFLGLFWLVWVVHRRLTRPRDADAGRGARGAQSDQPWVGR